MNELNRYQCDEEIRAELLAAGLSLEEGPDGTEIHRADGKETTPEQLDFLLRQAFGVTGTAPPTPRPRHWWREARRRARDMWKVLKDGVYVDD